MKIIRDREYLSQLKNILTYIKKDKVTASKKFKEKLDAKINDIPLNPYIHRKSHFFDDENYRDLIYKGYVVIYKIKKDEIWILEIFKWIDR